MKIWPLLLLLSLAGAAQAAEPMTGMRIFQTACATCHEEFARGQNKTGPVLYGVAGRRVGTAPGFAYSPSFQAAAQRGDVWTDARLDAYLAEPMAMYPHTGMTLLFVNPDDRAALIAYLKSRRPAKHP